MVEKKAYAPPVLRVLGTRETIKAGDADNPLKQAAREIAEEADERRETGRTKLSRS